MSKKKVIKSSNLKSAEYLPGDEVLILEFKNGTKYRYHPVPLEQYAAFERLFDGKRGSAGSYFYHNIRSLPCEKVEE